MRKLPKRMDHVLGLSACDHAKADGRSDSVGAERAQVPLWIASSYSSCGPARCERDGGSVMETKLGMNSKEVAAKKNRGTFTRRQFIQGTGILVVGFPSAGMAPWEALARAAQGADTL